MQSRIDADRRALDEMTECARRIAAEYARMCELAASCDPLEDDFVREEISCLLRVSTMAADRLLTTGRELTRRLRTTRAALAAGQISYEHARTIAMGLLPVADDAVADVESEAVALASQLTPGKLERRIAKAVVAAGPAEAERAAADAAEGRDVAVYPATHGMATLVATMPAPAAQEVMLALDAAADRREPGDPRTRGQRRADALHDWAKSALTSGELPIRHGRAVTVQVTMSAETALGLSNEPAELAGYGPIPAGMARRLAADATWRALLTDAATGRVLDVGRVAYRPTQAMRDLVLARFPTCTFPHCGRPAVSCDLDHRVAYADGGSTDTANLAPLCRRHHRLKTHGGWTPILNYDGSITWTSRQGRRYTTDPERRYAPDRNCARAPTEPPPELFEW